MKVCLINMPIRTAAPPNNPPLGIYYAGADLRLRGHDVCYVDLNVIRPVPTPDIACGLIPVNADVYGISGLITTLKWQRAVAKHIKAATGKPVISGGGLASNLRAETLKLIPEVDVAYAGYAEGGLADLLQDFPKERVVFSFNGPLDRKHAVWPDWANVADIETYINNPVWGEAAGNSSHTPFHMVRSLSMISSRGCPYACKFCSKDASGGTKFQPREARNVATEFQWLSRFYQLDFIGFLDDNMTLDPHRMKAICGWMDQETMWGCHSRFNAVDDIDLLKEMHGGGCRYIGFGGESANESILAAMDKRNNPVQMARVLELCREADIHPNVTWMVGWPGETRQQMRDTAQFILKHAPENQNLFVATAYPGTALWAAVQWQVLDRYGSLEAYVEVLGDATQPVMNYSALPDEEFYEILEGPLDAI